jgi:hypothetical protein
VRPAAAANATDGIVDGTYTTTFDTTIDKQVRTYPMLYFYGNLTAGDVTYQGGFYIAGLSDVLEYAPGHCLGLCVPLDHLGWVGQNTGPVHGFDPSPGAVDGQCGINTEDDFVTGPVDLVHIDRTIALTCSLSVEGGPVTSVSLTVTAASDSVADIAGSYAVS